MRRIGVGRSIGGILSTLICWLCSGSKVWFFVSNSPIYLILSLIWESGRAVCTGLLRHHGPCVALSKLAGAEPRQGAKSSVNFGIWQPRENHDTATRLTTGCYHESPNSRFRWRYADTRSLVGFAISTQASSHVVSASQQKQVSPLRQGCQSYNKIQGTD